MHLTASTQPRRSLKLSILPQSSFSSSFQSDLDDSHDESMMSNTSAVFGKRHPQSVRQADFSSLAPPDEISAPVESLHVGVLSSAADLYDAHSPHSHHSAPSTNTDTVSVPPSHRADPLPVIQSPQAAFDFGALPTPSPINSTRTLFPTPLASTSQTHVSVTPVPSHPQHLTVTPVAPSVYRPSAVNPAVIPLVMSPPPISLVALTSTAPDNIDDDERFAALPTPSATISEALRSDFVITAIPDDNPSESSAFSRFFSFGDTPKHASNAPTVTPPKTAAAVTATTAAKPGATATKAVAPSSETRSVPNSGSSKSTFSSVFNLFDELGVALATGASNPSATKRQSVVESKPTKTVETPAQNAPQLAAPALSIARPPSVPPPQSSSEPTTQSPAPVSTSSWHWVKVPPRPHSPLKPLQPLIGSLDIGSGSDIEISLDNPNVLDESVVMTDDDLDGLYDADLPLNADIENMLLGGVPFEDILEQQQIKAAAARAVAEERARRTGVEPDEIVDFETLCGGREAALRRLRREHERIQAEQDAEDLAAAEEQARAEAEAAAQQASTGLNRFIHSLGIDTKAHQAKMALERAVAERAAREAARRRANLEIGVGLDADYVASLLPPLLLSQQSWVTLPLPSFGRARPSARNVTFSLLLLASFCFVGFCSSAFLCSSRRILHPCHTVQSIRTDSTRVPAWTTCSVDIVFSASSR
jgi:hypothetical protein